MLLGFVIFLVGILLLVESVIPEFNVDFNVVWPAILIVITVYNIFKDKKSNLFNNVLLFTGIFFLLESLNVISDDMENIFFPFLIIIVGLSMIFKNFTFSNKYNIGKIDKDGRLEYSAVFGGVEEVVKVSDFKGAKINAIFGGSDLDFRNCEMKSEEVVIDINSIFGGSTIILPSDCKVIVNSIAVFGGNDNKYISNEKSKKVIYINCYSIFGGSEIK